MIPRWLWPLLLVLLAACTPTELQVQAATADAIATATNAALPVLVAAYERQGDDAIESAANVDSAALALDAVRAEWAPVWRAVDAFRAAHDAWATALERGQVDLVTAGKVRDAYCALRALVTGVDLPNWPLLACPPVAP